MKKIALALFALLLAHPALAVDNAVIVTPGTGITMKSKDIGAGVQAMQPVLSDTGGNALSTPTAGADGVSNTSTGLLGYARNLVFNGTTWDRWTGDTTNGAWVNVKSSVLPTGASTSANQASQITQETAIAAAAGTTADAPATLPASTTAASQVALLKAIANAANSPVPLGSASGGWTPLLVDALSTTVKGVKASAAGQLGELYCWNPNATVAYVQVFDVATTGGVTLGTTVPKHSYGIPPTSSGGYALSLVGLQFTAGIQLAATTTAKGLTAPGTAVDCNVAFN